LDPSSILFLKIKNKFRHYSWLILENEEHDKDEDEDET
jgi:hypothetical protein